jgi:hypothetical protein
MNKGERRGRRRRSLRFRSFSNLCPTIYFQHFGGRGEVEMAFIEKEAKVFQLFLKKKKKKTIFDFNPFDVH